MTTLRALWRLSRPLNVLIALLVVQVGFNLAGQCPLPWARLLAFLAVALITAGGNILNDVADLPVDRVAHPERPLPRGEVSSTLALAVAAAFLLLGVAAAWPLGSGPFGLALVAAGLLVFYNLRGKWIPLLGNLIVSLVSGLTFVFAGAVLGRPEREVFPFAFAFLLHLARELVKDLQDREGDLVAAGRTLALVWPRRRVLTLVRVVLALLILITPLPFFLGAYGPWYLAVVVLGVDFPLVSLILKLESAEPQSVSETMKTLMLVGLVALALWRF